MLKTFVSIVFRHLLNNSYAFLLGQIYLDLCFAQNIKYESKQDLIPRSNFTRKKILIAI